MTVRMNDSFASNLRAALVEHVEAGPARQHRARRNVAFGAALGVLLIGGGVAVASGVLPLPGGAVVTPLASSVTQSGSGTETVELGSPPAAATVIDIKLTCLTPGTFQTEDGATLLCKGADAPNGTMIWHLPVVPGRHSTTIRASTGQKWHLVATYSDVTTTPWGKNADGLTYGAANDNGTPDLLAVIATNGKEGYVYSRDLQVSGPTSLQTGVGTSKPIQLPVYTSDGHTVIGQFITNEEPSTSTP